MTFIIVRAFWAFVLLMAYLGHRSFGTKRFRDREK